MASKVIKVIATGKKEAMGRQVIQGLRPEVEGTFLFANPFYPYSPFNPRFHNAPMHSPIIHFGIYKLVMTVSRIDKKKNAQSSTSS